MVTFNALPLRPELMQGLTRLSYVEPTDIQAAALPLALAGRDLVGQARTGSGKTAVFALALLQQLDVPDRSPQALVLCPTRELAQQVTTSIRDLAVGLAGTRVVRVTGGSPLHSQRDALEAGAHVVVGTPGRVLQLLQDKTLSLSRLRCLVLDEADRMLDMGFEAQVREAIAFAPAKRQTLLFSATWPDTMAALSASIQRQPQHVGAADRVDDEVLSQLAILCGWQQRADALCHLLSQREPTPTVIFCETRQQCQQTIEMLKGRGASALALHGELEQRDRDEVLVRMRNHSTLILVATNVAARGLDLPELGLVISYEISSDPQVHIHRIGRTARADSRGEAIAFVCGAVEQRRLKDIEAHMGTRVPTQEWQPAASGALSAWAAPYETLVILGGRQDKLRAGDILGALTGDAGLQGSDVGAITLTDSRTWVAVRAPVAGRAASALNRVPIKKKRFRVHKVG